MRRLSCVHRLSLVFPLLLCISGTAFALDSRRALPRFNHEAWLTENGSPQTAGWRGIVPLRSTRGDVERLIGKPNIEYGLYDIANERVRISYSGDPCSEGLQGAYKVPRDTVVSIDVTPQNTVRLADLRLDPGKYQRTAGRPERDHSLYRNEEEGVTYLVSEGGGAESGVVQRIHYGPAAKDAHLRCPTPPTEQAAGAGCSGVKQAGDVTRRTGDLCPTILIGGPSGDKRRGQRHSYTATLAGLDARLGPTYKWGVSAGAIVSGQGTYAIEVDVSRAGGKPIIVTLEVGGVIPKGCQKVVCYATECPK